MGRLKEQRPRAPLPWVWRRSLDPSQGRDGALGKGTPPGGGLRDRAEVAKGTAEATEWTQPCTARGLQSADLSGWPPQAVLRAPHPQGLRSPHPQGLRARRVWAPLLGLSPSYFWDSRVLAPPALGTSGPELWTTSGLSGLTWVCRRH